jgi:Holliday junction DNA helicase RuvA
VIGLLRGRILGKQPPQLLIDVNGVGYEVDAPMTTFYNLPAVGAEVTLFTHLAVREDAHTLYGFLQLSDRDLFRNLLRVNGVGARLALVRLPGIGKKTAERLIIELRDRLPAATAAAGVMAQSARAASPVEDAVSALVGLGYKPQEASRMVRAINAAELSSEEIIRQALQGMVQ